MLSTLPHTSQLELQTGCSGRKSSDVHVSGNAMFKYLNGMPYSYKIYQKQLVLLKCCFSFFIVFALLFTGMAKHEETYPTFRPIFISGCCFSFHLSETLFFFRKMGEFVFDFVVVERV